MMTAVLLAIAINTPPAFASVHQSIGGTASFSPACYSEKISRTLSLGGRYQLLFKRRRYNRINPFYHDVAVNIIDRQYGHFFGITIAAPHMLHIGKKIDRCLHARHLRG